VVETFLEASSSASSGALKWKGYLWIQSEENRRQEQCRLCRLKGTGSEKCSSIGKEEARLQLLLLSP